MKKNVGNVEKLIRTSIAIILILLYVLEIVTGTAGIVLLVVAGVLIITSAVGFCGIHAMFGINTCKVKHG